MAIYGIKDNKALEEPIKVMEVAIQSGGGTIEGNYTLPTGWTTDNCLILSMISFNQRGDNFNHILKDFTIKTNNTFTISYENSGSATTGFIVLVKK